ncbi:MAG: 1-(5-phosphoribosyl)-5-[(5-phosphoribosylamino)methylideneamino]imidazole-4-carboxamide isomerase [Betaproteobacteria bacterium]
MIVVPAIDVRRGRVVRLKQGRASDETTYGADPAEVAQRWEREGAERIHLVDLDAAIDGMAQPEAVAAVITAVKVPVEVGGGIRSLEDAQRYREVGAERVIFGTAAVSRPDVVQAAVSRWPNAVAVAIDARDGRVAVEGWNELTAVDALELAAAVESWGVVRVQYTDVRRDGTLVGPNLDAIRELGRRTGLRITAAGGVSDVEDLVRLRELAPFGVDEVIVGKALYEGRLTLAEARAALAGATGRSSTGDAGPRPEGAR